MRLEHFDSLFDGIVPSLARILTKQHGIRGGGRIGVRQTQTADWQINEFSLGAQALSLNGFFTDFKGISWSIEGEGYLNQSTTLPNIIRQFNPPLKGASVTSQSTWDNINNIPYNDDLNVAFVGASARDLENQAKDLVSRLKNMKNIDCGNDWKLLTMWIGTEDLCQVCTEMDGKLVEEFFGLGCLHFSVQGYAAAALALWRNMLEPFGSKTKGWGDQENLKCPTKENPYLFTKTNSNTVMSELISDDDEDSASDDFPPAAAVALAVCLTAVVVIVVFVWRTRKSRRRPEARKLLYASGPHKPRI